MLHPDTLECKLCRRRQPLSEFTHGRYPDGRAYYRRTCRACYAATRNQPKRPGKVGSEWKYWLILYDPDGDFNNRQFPSIDIPYMVKLGGLSAGAKLQDPGGRVYRVQDAALVREAVS